MIDRIRNSALLGLLVATAFGVRAQGDLAPKYSNEFLQIGVGARALGMGGTVVGSSKDLTSGYWNPAGLTGIESFMEASFMHAEYFAGIAKYDYLGWAMPIDDKSAISFTGIRFGVDDIPNTTQLIDAGGNVNYDKITTFSAADYAALVSYARELTVPGLSLGGTFKVVYRKVGDFAHSWGFGLDAGVRYDLGERWKFGAVLRDATSTFNAWMFTLDDQTKEVFQVTGNEIPENGLELTLPRLIVGAAGEFQLGKGFYIMPELDVDMTFDGRRNVLFRTSPVAIDPHLGFEIGYKPYVALRAGMTNIQWFTNLDGTRDISIQPNMGLGVAFKGVSLDYAFTNVGSVGAVLYSHIFSLKVEINKKNKEVPQDGASSLE